MSLYVKPNPDPDILELRSRAGCGNLIGIPIIIYGYWWVWTMFATGDITYSIWIFIYPAFSIPFGTALLFGVGRHLINRRTRTYTSALSVLGFDWKHHRSIANHDLVTAEHTNIIKVIELRGNVSQSETNHPMYPVRLVVQNPQLHPPPTNLQEGHERHFLTITNAQSAADARRLGELIAKHLNLPFQDETLGVTVRREAGTLDDSLRDRLLRRGHRPHRPEPLPDTRIRSIPADSPDAPRPLNGPAANSDPQTPRAADTAPRTSGAVADTGDTADPICLLLPTHGITRSVRSRLALGLIAIVVPGFPALAHLAAAGVSHSIAGLILLAVFIPGLVILTTTVAAIFTTQAIHASPSGLIIERRSFLGTARTEIPIHDLEELEILNSTSAYPEGASTIGKGTPFLLVRSDTASYHLAESLTPSELRWIKRMIEYAICT